MANTKIPITVQINPIKASITYPLSHLPIPRRPVLIPKAQRDLLVCKHLHLTDLSALGQMLGHVALQALADGVFLRD